MDRQSIELFGNPEYDRVEEQDDKKKNMEEKS